MNGIDKCKGRLRIAFLVTALVIFGFPFVSSAKTLFINLVLVNPSETAAKKYPVKYYLPVELGPGDLVDMGDLSVEYDVKKSQYYVKGEIELKAKESKTLKLEVQDVWRLGAEEVNVLKGQINKNLEVLSGTEYEKSAKALREDMFRELDGILLKQESYSDNIERRIEESRAQAAILAQIRKNAFSLDYFKTKKIPSEELKTFRFMIEVKNPSLREARTLRHKHFLPHEVKSEDIVDLQGFDFRFDEARQQPFLTKEENFNAGETKRYAILIKDVWGIPPSQMAVLRERSEDVFQELKGTDYEQQASFLLQDILGKLKDIETAQAEKAETVEKHIGIFRINKERYRHTEETLQKLEQLFSLAKVGGQGVGFLGRLRGLKGIAAISQAVFGTKISLSLIWKVILGMIVFLFVFTGLHFFIWWKRSAGMGESSPLGEAEGIRPVSHPPVEPAPEKEKGD